MAHIPDEAILSGNEVSFAARAVYAVICLYRAVATGECKLTDRKRIAREAGVRDSDYPQVEDELLRNGWLEIDLFKVLKPVKGHFPGNRERQGKRPKLKDDDFVDELQASGAYPGIDCRLEFLRAENWCRANARLCTKRFFVNWLNRTSPMQVENLNGNSNGNGAKQYGGYKSAVERQADSIRETKESIAKDLAEVFDIDKHPGSEPDGGTAIIRKLARDSGLLGDDS